MKIKNIRNQLLVYIWKKFGGMFSIGMTLKFRLENFYGINALFPRCYNANSNKDTLNKKEKHNFWTVCRNSILRYECDKVLFRRISHSSPERSEGDNSIRHDKTFMHECRMRFYNTTRLERATVVDLRNQIWKI